MGFKLKVKISIYMMLRKKLGWSSKEVEVKGEEAKLRDILRKIPGLKELTEDPNFTREYMVLVNGINVALKDGLETIVKDGMKIDIFPPGGGG